MIDYSPTYALTLPMLTLMALDELRTAARHRRPSGGPVFLGPVRTEAFWLASERHPVIRRTTSSFKLGDMMTLFELPLNYPLLDCFETHLSSALWMMVTDLRIVDGSSFIDLLPGEVTAAAGVVHAAHDNEVALLMRVDRTLGQFRLTAAVVN